MRTRAILIGLTMLLVLILGTGLIFFSTIRQSQTNSHIETTRIAAVATNERVQAIIDATSQARTVSVGQSTPVPQQQAQQRLVIRNAALTLRVADPELKISEISAMAEEMGGWVVNSAVNRTGTDENPIIRGTITIRVLAQRFTEAVERLKDGATAVDAENVTGQDVTADYVDLSSRVANLQAAEAQLREFLEQTGNTNDMLSVYNRLIEVRGQIEEAQGRMQYFEQAAAYSSITVSLNPDTLPESPLVVQQEWSIQSTFDRVLVALTNLLRLAVDILIWLVLFVLPMLLLFGIPAYIAYRGYRYLQRQTKPSHVK
jgi:hypothetical protein